MLGDDFVLFGDPATYELYRLFGDADGDGDVDTRTSAFRRVFGSVNNIFDFDNDGDVDTSATLGVPNAVWIVDIATARKASASRLTISFRVAANLISLTLTGVSIVPPTTNQTLRSFPGSPAAPPPCCTPCFRNRSRSGRTIGYAVAVSDNYRVVGAVSSSGVGRVYVYSSLNNAAIAILNNPGGSDDQFGHSVSAAGKYVVVGARYNDTGDTNSGIAHVYDVSSATPSIPILTLFNPTPSIGETFGSSVAVTGNIVVVGLSGDHIGGVQQARPTSTISTSSTTPTVPVWTLINPTPSNLDVFGASVAASGNFVVVGAFGDDAGATDAGSAYVYDLNAANPTIPFATLNNPTPAVDDWFGSSVAASGKYIAVARTGTTPWGRMRRAVYVYDMTFIATIPIYTVYNPAAGPDNYFGTSVAAAGNYLVVGTPSDDNKTSSKRAHSPTFSTLVPRRRPRRLRH